MVQTFSLQSYAFLSPGLNGCTLTKLALFALFSCAFFGFFLRVVEGGLSPGKHEKNSKLNYL